MFPRTHFIVRNIYTTCKHRGQRCPLPSQLLAGFSLLVLFCDNGTPFPGDSPVSLTVQLALPALDIPPCSTGPNSADEEIRSVFHSFHTQGLFSEICLPPVIPIIAKEFRLAQEWNGKFPVASALEDSRRSSPLLCDLLSHCPPSFLSLPPTVFFTHFSIFFF